MAENPALLSDTSGPAARIENACINFREKIMFEGKTCCSGRADRKLINNENQMIINNKVEIKKEIKGRVTPIHVIIKRL
jgi:hypothetical protein